MDQGSPPTSGTELTRFNALRHGILSRYTVLPWEDSTEYRAIVAAFTEEHQPQGPTEEHLVEELAGIMWRKRRLRLAEAAVHHRGLQRALEPSRRQRMSLTILRLMLGKRAHPSRRLAVASRPRCSTERSSWFGARLRPAPRSLTNYRWNREFFLRRRGHVKATTPRAT